MAVQKSKMGSRLLAKRAEITFTKLPFVCDGWSLLFST